MAEKLKVPASLFGNDWAAKSRSLKEAWDNSDEEVEIIHHFTILHKGWEMDNDGWIVSRSDGTLHYLTTSHGGWRIGTADDLIAVRKETEESLNGIKKALGNIEWRRQSGKD